jgi:hypothetical protein
MPTLAEYLGLLLTEITKARVQADIEAARIAELYATHPLLQHMPVPRFRLPNVSLDLPVAIERTDPTEASGPSVAELDAARKRVDGIVEQELRALKIQLSPGTRKTIAGALDAIFARLSSGTMSAFDVARAPGEAAADVVAALKTGNERERSVDAEPARTTLGRALEPPFTSLLPKAAPVEVVVATAQLREIAPPQALTRVHLTVSEEGVEWTQTDPDDATTKRLVPE